MKESWDHPLDWAGKGGAGDAWKKDIPILDRFLEEVVRRSWRELLGEAGQGRTAPEFSGILPLGHPGLPRFLSHPGVFLVVGPPPNLPLLHVGHSAEPMDLAVRAWMRPDSIDASPGSWGVHSDPPQVLLACVALAEHGALAHLLGELLTRRLQARPPSQSRGAPTHGSG